MCSDRSSDLSTVYTYTYTMWSELWSTYYNGDDCWLPFFVPLVIWVSTFLYCHVPFQHNEQQHHRTTTTTTTTPTTIRRRPTFHQWQGLHSFHNYGAIVLGMISMYYNDDTVFNERIPILWSTGYFIVDVVDCVYRYDGTYFIHAILCLVLGGANYRTPLCRHLRMNSKATLCELSNGFMHLAKRTRTPWHFLTFAVVFTLCRILWIPHLMYDILHHGMSPMDPIFICLAAFYGLNVFWWYKIIKIIIKGPSKDDNTQKKAN